MPVFFLLPPLIGLALLGGGIYLALRFVRAFEQRNIAGPEVDELRARLARLEEALDSTNNEVQRLAEAQHFTTRLLEGRTETTNR